ncbi:MAG: hypothetical protein WA974_06440 [Thermodesulfobacteriota bacterium]
MFYRRDLITMAVVILGLVMFVPVAQAEQQNIEGISCVSINQTPVQASPGEIYVGSFDGKGIFRSTHENKLADNNTFHQVGVVKTEGGKFIWNGLHKSMNPDGDYAIWEFYGDSQSGTTMKIIYGSGKNKGAKGELKSQQITKGKPIVLGTDQACHKVVGWIEFAK